MNKIVKVQNISYRYDQNLVLNQVQFELKKGDYLGIVGPNGSGKSTIIKLLLNLLSIQKGEIFLFGVPIDKFDQWERIGYVSQKAASFNSGFPATVEEVIMSGLTKKAGLFTRFNHHHKEKCAQVLNKVGMTSFAKRNIGELSGGQQQRVFIARALISEPEFLILDEPTVGVDEQNVRDFYELLNKLNQELHLTILIVSHDTDYIVKNANRIIQMNNSIVFDGETDDYNRLKSKQMHDIYGCLVEEVNRDDL